MKLMVMGYGRHGKDTVCEMLGQVFGMTYESSSRAAAEIFLFDSLAPVLGYKTVDECFDDRHNYRALWHELIKAYNAADKARLARGIFSRADIYAGIRAKDELEAARAEGLFDYAVWVDASDRHPPEDASSCAVHATDTDYILYNNGTLCELRSAVIDMVAHLGKRYQKEHA